ncbi:hypothetical protein M3Y97_00873800 [Aphelenchoides bicaudatus]|nr:hypothetical protein M3Y97_00873800 [Aphelenchoides bicaudatus]
MDRFLPPPPVSSKRNESMNSAMSSYRNRPSGSSNPASHFANAKNLFESFNTPAVRNVASAVANNPLLRKGACALAKNETVRTTAVNAAVKHATGNEPDPLTNKMAHASIKSMVNQFEGRPIMGMSTASETPANRTSQHSMGNYSYDPKPLPPCNSSLTATQIDPFENPPQISSSYSHQLTTDSYSNRSKSTEPFSYGFTSDYQQSKKVAPSRPPPPAKMSNSWSNPSLSSPETLTNKAHAIAKYPYKSAHADELSFEPKDTLLLEREVNDQWVSAVNTRSGQSGIVPISFLDIKIPLAPSSVVLPPRQQNIPLPTQPVQADLWGNTKQVMKALYDYHSGVEGDLDFNAGDLIVVYEKVSDEWYNGEFNKKFGIFPASFVQQSGPDMQSPTLKSPPVQAAAAKTVVALYDYNSGVADDLVFFANDVIEVVEEMDEWIKGRLHGIEGLVPLTYVQRN